MSLQVQRFFKNMNAQCNVLNIGQPVLQVMTDLSFASRVLKNDHKVPEISAKVIVKKCNYSRVSIYCLQICY